MSHEQLTTLMNGGCATRLESLASVFAPRWVRHRNAARFEPPDARPDARWPAPELVTIAPYGGAVREVCELRDYLARHLRTELAGVYVHGSLGTGEPVAYSDFDAVAVVRTDVIADRRRLGRTAYHLNVARKFMLRFDPLQHHGWFVLGEAQLGDYPEAFLPVAALRAAKTLLPDEPQTLRIAPRAGSGAEACVHCAHILRTLDRRISGGTYPRDAYALKVFLSNVMLLPAVYVHARDGRGVFKRESFDAARQDFPAGVWAVMGEISEMRREWRVPIDPARRLLLTRVSPLRHVGKRLAPPIPSALAARLTTSFYARVHALIRAFEERLAGQENRAVS